MGLLGKTRRQTYRAARGMGNVQAALRGPVPLAKRMVRRKVYRTVNGGLGRLLRKGGLM
jgi:hypothetical protein